MCRAGRSSASHSHARTTLTQIFTCWTTCSPPSTRLWLPRSSSASSSATCAAKGARACSPPTALNSSASATRWWWSTEGVCSMQGRCARCARAANISGRSWPTPRVTRTLQEKAETIWRARTRRRRESCSPTQLRPPTRTRPPLVPAQRVRGCRRALWWWRSIGTRDRSPQRCSSTTSARRGGPSRAQVWRCSSHSRRAPTTPATGGCRSGRLPLRPSLRARRVRLRGCWRGSTPLPGGCAATCSSSCAASASR
mmetsp:Transcript_19759/g.46314  ORF Transcript_19759/g.46314 Transcript_19759/m.46314 type:complete len:254 (-) Transcript_19759:2294-3055(-)